MPTLKEAIVQEAQSLRDDVTFDEALSKLYFRMLLEQKTDPACDDLKRYTPDEARAELRKWLGR